MTGERGTTLAMVLSTLLIIAAIIAGYSYWQNQQIKKAGLNSLPKNSINENQPNDQRLNLNSETRKVLGGGYEFMIPENWLKTVGNNSQEVVLKKGADEISIWRSQINLYGSLEKWFKEGLATAPGYDKTAFSITYQNGHKILRNEKSGQQPIFAIDLNGKEALQISCYCQNQNGFISTFDQILSTFKFTN